MRYDYDFIVVGSGFGGSVCALRLSEKGYRVGVIEKGRRWTPETLPTSTWNLRRWLWRPALGLRGFMGVRFFSHLLVLHGNAVGGGSIAYANTLLEPPAKVWGEGSWAGLQNWHDVLPRHYATAKRMLGVTTNRIIEAADRKLLTMAERRGVEASFYPTEVGVFFGQAGDPPGTFHSDPFFGGAGPDRRSCNACGGCMVGCRYGAKNTLDQNYLYLAEGLGTDVHAETCVVDVRPLVGDTEGAHGYQVTTVSSAGFPWQSPARRTCRGIIFAASSLGTQDLLLRLKERGSLPLLSDALGRHVRTNAESLIGVRYPGCQGDLSAGIAIGTGIHLSSGVHIQAVRYPSGSDAIALISTVMPTRGRGWRRITSWFSTLLRLMVRRPLTALRTLNPFGFARETVILLCMQTLEGELTMRLKRPWYWPFHKQLASDGAPLPSSIADANAFAIAAAEATGGIAATSITEVLFNIPTTAHCIGGAVMGAGPRQGVVDGRNRVFGYRNMYICDGSVLAANLGVNPSLTITAVAEHAMSHLPHASEQDWSGTDEAVSAS